jgi:signal transduction histidine kinase
MPVSPASVDLAEVLERHRDVIVGRWVDRVERAGLRHYLDRPREELATWCARLLDLAIDAARSGDPRRLVDYIDSLTRDRHQLGFALEEVIEAGLLLTEAALPSLLTDLSEPAGGVGELDAIVRLIIVRFTSRFVVILRAQQEQVAALEERQRVARDLHDSLSQSLCGVSMYAEAAARLLGAGQLALATQHIHQLRQDALDALREMRRMIYELRPATLEERGLAAALRERLATVEARAGVQASLLDGVARRLPPAVEDGLYHVAQEALNNALRHGHASRVEVRLHPRDGRLSMEVEDNGHGFDVGGAEGGGGLGLVGMRERVSRLGGQLVVDSAPGRGTRILVDLPGPQA